MRSRQTRLMTAVEQREGQPLSTLLPTLIREHGHSGAAERLSVSKATITYWCLKLGIRLEVVALGPGQTFTVHQTR